MNGLIRLAVGTAVLAVSVAAGAQALYQDERAPVDARVAYNGRKSGIAESYLSGDTSTWY